MITTPLPRVPLATTLGVSPATLDRWIAAGLLQPVGSRGRQQLYRLADARRAQRAASETATARATIGWLAAMADEARSGEYRLRAEWVHRNEWVPSWEEVLARVETVLREWAASGSAELAAVIRDPRRALGDTWPLAEGPRAVGVAVQQWTHGVLGRLAALPLTWPPPPPSPTPELRPRSITDARGRLVRARTEWTTLRTRVKTEPGWRSRTELGAARDGLFLEAREAIRQGLPAALLRLGEPDLVDLRAVRAALEATVASVLQILRELNPPVGRSTPPSPTRRPRKGRREAGGSDFAGAIGANVADRTRRGI